MTDERALRLAIDTALREHDDCDLARRIRKELGRNYDSNTTNRRRQMTAKRAAEKQVSDWAFEHLIEVGQNHKTSTGRVLAQDAFDVFRVRTCSTIGKRAFYDALRAADYRLVKCDPFGREGSGPLTVVGVELLP